MFYNDATAPKTMMTIDTATTPSTKNHRREQPGQMKQQSNNKVMSDRRQGGDRTWGDEGGKQTRMQGRDKQHEWELGMGKGGTGKGGMGKGGTSSVGPKRHPRHLLGCRFFLFLFAIWLILLLTIVFFIDNLNYWQQGGGDGRNEEEGHAGMREWEMKGERTCGNEGMETKGGGEMQEWGNWKWRGREMREWGNGNEGGGKCRNEGMEMKGEGNAGNEGTEMKGEGKHGMSEWEW